MDSLIYGAVSQWLDAIFEGVDAKNLDTSQFLQQIELKDLNLRPALLNQLSLPVRLVAGCVGTIRVDKLTNLFDKGEKVSVSIENVCLLLAPGESLSDPDQAIAAHQWLLTAEEAFNNMYGAAFVEEVLIQLRDHGMKRYQQKKKKKGYLEKKLERMLLKNLLPSLEVNCSKIHIRLEDSTHQDAGTGMCTALGLKLPHISLSSGAENHRAFGSDCLPQWIPSILDPLEPSKPKGDKEKRNLETHHKVFGASQILAYCNFETMSYLPSGKGNLRTIFEYMWPKESNCLLLGPLNLEAGCSFDQWYLEKGAIHPQYDLRRVVMSSSEVKAVLDAVQMQELINFTQSMLTLQRKMLYRGAIPRSGLPASRPPHSLPPEEEKHPLPQMVHTAAAKGESLGKSSALEAINREFKTKKEVTRALWQFAINSVIKSVRRRPKQLNRMRYIQRYKAMMMAESAVFLHKSGMKLGMPNVASLTVAEHWQLVEDEREQSSEEVLFLRACARVSKYRQGVMEKKEMKWDLTEEGAVYAACEALRDRLRLNGSLREEPDLEADQSEGNALEKYVLEYIGRDGKSLKETAAGGFSDDEDSDSDSESTSDDETSRSLSPAAPPAPIVQVVKLVDGGLDGAVSWLRRLPLISLRVPQVSLDVKTPLDEESEGRQTLLSIILLGIEGEVQGDEARQILWWEARVSQLAVREYLSSGIPSMMVSGLGGEVCSEFLLVRVVLDEKRELASMFQDGGECELREKDPRRAKAFSERAVFRVHGCMGFVSATSTSELLAAIRKGCEQGETQEEGKLDGVQALINAVKALVQFCSLDFSVGLSPRAPAQSLQQMSLGLLQQLVVFVLGDQEMGLATSILSAGSSTSTSTPALSARSVYRAIMRLLPSDVEVLLRSSQIVARVTAAAGDVIAAAAAAVGETRSENSRDQVSLEAFVEPFQCDICRRTTSSRADENQSEAIWVDTGSIKALLSSNGAEKALDLVTCSLLDMTDKLVTLGSDVLSQ
ncbi:unnamed protein product [Chrysoparadoxa australica]